MGIITAPTVKSRIKIVYVRDPDVTPKDPNDQGWIRCQDAAVRGGATVLEIVPLNRDQYTACLDAGGVNQMQLARGRAAIKSVNGDESMDAIEALLESPDLFEPLFSLGQFIKAVSDAEDPQAELRPLFRQWDEIDARRARGREETQEPEGVEA
jgi:hypothetical protein